MRSFTAAATLAAVLELISAWGISITLSVTSPLNSLVSANAGAGAVVLGVAAAPPDSLAGGAAVFWQATKATQNRSAKTSDNPFFIFAS
jgi:hypothetical protein